MKTPWNEVSVILAGFLLRCRGAGSAMVGGSFGENELAVAGEAEPVFFARVQQNRLARAAEKRLHFDTANRGTRRLGGGFARLIHLSAAPSSKAGGT